MSEENKAHVRRTWEIVNQHNPDLIEEFYPPDFVWHEPDQDIQGYEQAKQYVGTYFQAFPDINITVDDVIAEGDQAVSRYTIRGTHQGETEDFGCGSIRSRREPRKAAASDAANLMAQANCAEF
jgi:predicted ester cyclase